MSVDWPDPVVLKARSAEERLGISRPAAAFGGGSAECPGLGAVSRSRGPSLLWSSGEAIPRHLVHPVCFQKDSGSILRPNLSFRLFPHKGDFPRGKHEDL